MKRYFLLLILVIGVFRNSGSAEGSRRLKVNMHTYTDVRLASDGEWRRIPAVAEIQVGSDSIRLAIRYPWADARYNPILALKMSVKQDPVTDSCQMFCYDGFVRRGIHYAPCRIQSSTGFAISPCTFTVVYPDRAPVSYTLYSDK